MENNNQENILETSVEETVVEEAVVEETVAETPVEVDKKAQFMDKINVVAEKLEGFVKKGVELFKTNPKKYGIIGGAGLVGVVAVIVALTLILGSLGNNYKTPINIMEDYANAKKYYSDYDKMIDMSNGFCQDELEDLVKLYKSTEDYKDDLEDEKDDFADTIEDMKDEYGKNYKYTYKITDKEELDKDDLKEFRDRLRSTADSLESMIEETEDYDSDDWEDMADSIGFDGDKSKAKKLVKIMKNMRKVYKSAKVTAGYELEVTITLDGSELDEPEENEVTINVYKVDGRWISSSSLGLGSMF